MDVTDLVINILAYFITLSIFLLPIILGIKILKAGIKAFKKNLKKRKNKNQYNSPSDWHSEWKWDEEQQLWIHPKSEKATKQESTYRYSKDDVPKEQPTQQTHFHHTDTTFKAPQKPEPEIKIEIPPDVLEKINTAKQTPPQEDKPDTNGHEQQNAPGTKPEQTAPKKQQKPKNQPQIIYTYKRAELPPSERAIADDLDFMNSYQRRQLFTKNEWKNYKKLKDIAEVKGYVICPKVRLFDLIEPRADKKKKLTYRYKIQSKHVDFVICDKDMNIKAILELDDSSHKDPERMKRDDFVNTILLSVGYTVIHTKYIDYDILDLI